MRTLVVVCLLTSLGAVGHFIRLLVGRGQLLPLFAERDGHYITVGVENT